ncbi:DUF5715 family protein [Vaginella massiliensis]|uniref:DUF5715 family protein n=1 Tax=Vaginella massiliensis TaxID=1816680 RepID=UPI0037527FCE
MKRFFYAAAMMSSIGLFAQSSVNVEDYILNMNLANYKKAATVDYTTEIKNQASFSAVSSSSSTKRAVFLKDKITYSDHVFEASSFDVPLITDFIHMESLVNENKLFEVPEITDTYVLQKLTHSRPYLIKPALEILYEVSEKFKLETGTRLSISSLTRTLETQQKLRRVNSNAAKGNSAHEYGAAFDISYAQYDDGIRGRNYTYESVMKNILDQLVTEGKIYYIKERRQPCFHITVRNPNLVYPEMLSEEYHQHL